MQCSMQSSITMYTVSMYYPYLLSKSHHSRYEKIPQISIPRLANVSGHFTLCMGCIAATPARMIDTPYMPTYIPAVLFTWRRSDGYDREGQGRASISTCALPSARQTSAASPALPSSLLSSPLVSYLLSHKKATTQPRVNSSLP